MRDKPEVILKYICMGLGALLFIQFIRVILNANPLVHVVVPALPSLADDSVTTNQPTIASSNVTPPVHSRQIQNSPARTNVSVLMTNVAVTTNIAARAGSRTNTEIAVTTNIAAHAGFRTNTDVPFISGTNSNTNAVASSVPGTNTVTNTIAIHSGHRHRRPNQFGDGMGFMPGMPGQKKTTVTPAIQASIDRITDSEILGPVIHPLPMALLGIAGDVAFLRSPDGQTGLVKAGDELGTIKLIKIGTNRVLIEEDGQQKELTIFDGMGGESLLDKSLHSTNENNNP